MEEARKRSLVAEADSSLVANPPPALDEFRSLAKRLYVAGESRLALAVEDKLRSLALRDAAQMLAAGAADSVHAQSLAKVLRAINECATARRVLEMVWKRGGGGEELAQQLSLSTYKDEELQPDIRFRDALAILDTIGLRDRACRNPETLGQGGAIYKRMWERSGQIEHLHTALHFYRKGWSEDGKADMGYCGVNAAYILDVLGFRARTAARRENAGSTLADDYESQASALRSDIRNLLAELLSATPGLGNQYWFAVTLAEANFGLGKWPEAEDWLARARLIEHGEWERQTTTRQLVSIARMRGIAAPVDGSEPKQWTGPWQALYAFLQDEARAVLDCHRGKVGLALSGGGFRASLFHLGVLARLAECDVLSSVEVLSSVSGGSVVAAHYYLALRQRMHARTDLELTRAEYVALVREVMDQFCAGVGENLRVRLFSNLGANLKMLFLPSYGRSNRMGELYERHFYARVKDEHNPSRLRRMRDLLVHPLLRKGSNGNPDEHDLRFKPKFSNWRRAAKVPILLLNTTSLNSGHNWQFTASWMGEPPGLVGQEVDMNERYRRLYYEQAPNEALKNFPLSFAVAASAGVPALFDPLVLKDLYPGRTLRLVDGGVHDNQGVAGLLDEGCNLILCSDASGQMNNQDSPPGNSLGVFVRSDSIFQSRMREAQYLDLSSRLASNALQGLFFVHLKQELESDPVDWIGCDDPRKPEQRPSATSYGVDRTLQRLMSEFRTDLDSFTEVEMFSLMTSGYNMTERNLQLLDAQHQASGLPGSWGGFDIVAAQQNDWPFLKLRGILAADPAASDQRALDMKVQFQVASQLFGKVWRLVPWLRNLALVLAATVVGAGMLWIGGNWNRVIEVDYRFGVGAIVITGGLVVLGFLVPAARYLRLRSAGQSALAMLFMGTFGWVASNLHLYLFDRWFKQRGSLRRLLNLPSK